jgi:hypothetical protein
VPRRGPHAGVYNLELVDLEEPGRSWVVFDPHADDRGPRPHDLPTFPLPAECWLDQRWIVVDTLNGMRGRRQLIDLDSEQGQVDPGGPESRPEYQRRRAIAQSLTPRDHATQCYSRGSTGSDSSASTPKTHS